MSEEQESVEIPEETARYGGFAAMLDCELCGSSFFVEGDVSNDEIVRCDGCGELTRVYGR